MSSISLDSIPAANDADYAFQVGKLYHAALHSLDAQQLRIFLRHPKCQHYFDSRLDPDEHYSDFHYSHVYSLAMSEYLTPEEAAKMGEEGTIGSRETFHERKSGMLAVMLNEWEKHIEGACSSLLIEHLKNSSDNEEQLLTTEQLWNFRNAKSPVASLDEYSQRNFFELLEMSAYSDAKRKWAEAKRRQFEC